MRYTLKQIHCRPWTLNGLSLKLIESHYENNYGGALRRLNAITEQLESLDFANDAGLCRERPQARGAGRRSIPPCCTSSISRASAARASRRTRMSETLARDFGSLERWRAEFCAMGYALGGGSGWVLLTYVPRDGRLDQPVRGRTCAGDRGRHADPRARHVRARLPHRLRRQRQGLRGYVHAQHRLAGGRRAATRTRRRSAPPRAARPAGIRRRAGGGRRGGEGDAGCRQRRAAHRRAPEALRFAAAGHRRRASTWRDPERLQDWMGELSKSEPVVVYCAYGFHVGCGTAVKLREAGFDAKYMKPGHSGWKAIGGSIKMHP